MAALFPDAYLHIGGDESEGKHWDKNPKIQAFMKKKGIKDHHALQAYFNQRLSKILTKHGKKMVGWDEILHPDLPKNVVVHSWRGPASLAQAAKNGYNGILSAGYYIDLIHPAGRHYAVDPLPAGTDLTDEQAAHVLGGEATMWGEYVGPETIDSRIWPRLAAIAERLWSPRTVVDVADMYRRLAVVSIQLEELGLTHEKNAAMLLRRLARSHEVGPLRTLVSVLEPVKEYRRGRQRPTTMLSPLTSLVDAARPDSEAARRFAALVNGLLADAPRFQAGRDELAQVFAEWRDARPAIEAMSERSAALRDAGPLAQDLSDMGAMGLEALSHLSSGTAPNEGWQASAAALLERAAKPRAAVEFAVVPSFGQLIKAAAENGKK
jgi:hexosaminidase